MFVGDHVGIRPKDSFVQLRVTALISFVWPLFYGPLPLLLLFIVPLSSTKLMLKIWRPCFTCTFGVMIIYNNEHNLFLLLSVQHLLPVDLTFYLLLPGTSLVVTVVRSFGNDHRHLGVWCWTQTGRTGKASTCAVSGCRFSVFVCCVYIYIHVERLWNLLLISMDEADKLISYFDLHPLQV